MKEKEYEFSLILGRFNHIHLGHKMLIDESIKKAKKTLVLIGSMQEKGTLRNPFSYDTRKRLIEKIYNETGYLWEKYNVVTGTIAESESHRAYEMMGWSAGVYIYCKNLLK